MIRVYCLGDLKSIVAIIGEVEVRIIEGNCVDVHKAPGEVNIPTTEAGAVESASPNVC